MKKLCLEIMVVSFFFLTSCSLSVPSPAAAGEVFLESVGVDYSNSKVSTLFGTVADACETALCLSDVYKAKGVDCSVDLLTSTGTKTPDSNTILLDLLSLQPQEDDLVVFYFSGHGGFDSLGPFIAGSGTEDSDYTKLYMSDLFEVLSGFPCRSVVILDCCYAGKMAGYTVCDRDFAKAVSTMFSVSEKNKTAVIASSLADQSSLVSAVFTEEGTGESHSLFTLALLRTLGWVHSSSQKRSLDGNEVYGYLGTEPQCMTVGDLYEAITAFWTSEVQIPEINRTDVPVKIIPDKEWKK